MEMSPETSASDCKLFCRGIVSTISRGKWRINLTNDAIEVVLYWIYKFKAIG